MTKPTRVVLTVELSALPISSSAVQRCLAQAAHPGCPPGVHRAASMLEPSSLPEDQALVLIGEVSKDILQNEVAQFFADSPFRVGVHSVTYKAGEAPASTQLH